MFRRLLVIAALTAAACTPEAPELTADEREIEECFGSAAPDVPDSAAAGRGFTADEMRTVIFGTSPDATPPADGEPDPQLLTILDVFAGLSRADYKALEDELAFLDDFFSTAATQVALAPRLIAATQAAKQAPAQLRLAPASVANAYRTATHNPCRETTRSAGKLTLTLSCGGVSGSVVFAASAPVLDAVDALIHGEAPNISTPLRETLTITFQNAAAEKDGRQTAINGVVTVAFDMSAFTIQIDETTEETNIKVVGSLDVRADALTLKNTDTLTSEVLETGTLATQIAARFNIDALSTFDRNQQLDGSGTTESQLRVPDGTAVVNVISLKFTLGKNSADASGTLAINVTAEQDSASEYDQDGKGKETERLALGASMALDDGSIVIANPKGKVTLALGGKGSAKVLSNNDNAGSYNAADGYRNVNEESMAFKLACGFANVQIDRAGGASSQAGIRLHGLAGNEYRGESTGRYIEQPYYQDDSFSLDDGTSYLKSLVFKVDLLGKTARGALPRWVNHQESGSRSASSYGDSYESLYDQAVTNTTELDTAGYVSFAGHPYVFKMAPALEITEVAHNWYSDGQEDYTFDPQAVGAFQLVSGDKLEVTMVRKDSPEPHLEGHYTLNDTVLLPYDSGAEGAEIPSDPFSLFY